MPVSVQFQRLLCCGWIHLKHASMATTIINGTPQSIQKNPKIGLPSLSTTDAITHTNIHEYKRENNLNRTYWCNVLATTFALHALALG
jgi:hypothetical protein